MHEQYVYYLLLNIYLTTHTGPMDTVWVTKGKRSERMRQRMNVDTQKKCKDAGQTKYQFGLLHWSFSEKLYLEKSREYLFQK